MKKLEDIDLNLLLLLHWLLVERSVTRAGERVSLSQPAASRALGRLRDLFGDELLVQSGRTLIPTKLALNLAPELEIAVGQMRRAIRQDETFNPETFEGTLSFASNDYLASVASHILSEEMTALSVNLNSTWRPLSADVMEDVISGRIDFVLAPEAARAAIPKTAAMEDMVIKSFLTDTFVLFGPKSHPAFQVRRLDLAMFADLDQVMVSPSGSGPGIVDKLLAKENLSRRVRYRTWSFLHAAELALSTQSVAVLPARLAKHHPHGATRALPLKVPPITSFIAWHSNRTKDPVHKWVRQQLLGVST